jgi:hypothetical protein
LSVAFRALRVFTTDMGEHEMSHAAHLRVVFEPEVHLQGGLAAR